MKVLFVAAEVAPFAKVGGLADVAGSLPKALAALGHDVRVLMPAYRMVLDDPRWGVEAAGEFPVDGWRAKLWHSKSHGLDLWLIGGIEAFDLVEDSRSVYSPDRDAYLDFSRAALQMQSATGWLPDVVHAHDWHTGFIPVLIKEDGGHDWDRVASVFTVHNLAYQGEFGADTLDRVGLPRSLYNMHQLETFGSVNFLKAGCVFADQVNTVSPTYAREIQTSEYGCRLEGLMAWLAGQGRLRGILNGIDTEVFDPTSDPHIVAHYSADDLSGKAICRQALLEGFGLEGHGPMLGVVSRLSEQKGFDLILGGMERLLDLGCSIVVLGTGDPWAARSLGQWHTRRPDRVVLAERFDIELAQRIYSGVDAFLMPSAFEPCGLGQMIAMRYGSVPIVRKTGGLADTVFEGKNGFVFEAKTADALAEAVGRACHAMAEPAKWARLVEAGMREDFGWSRSAADYVRMYEDALRGKSALVGKRDAVADPV